MSNANALTKPTVIKNAIDGWNVEQFTNDGTCYMAIFSGPYAEKRALEYADFVATAVEAPQ